MSEIRKQEREIGEKKKKVEKEMENIDNKDLRTTVTYGCLPFLRVIFPLFDLGKLIKGTINVSLGNPYLFYCKSLLVIL